jgi:steroid delta-isomerase-like uncharacterized protein
MALLLLLLAPASAVLAQSTPAEQRNLELYQQLIAAENAGDYEQMQRLFSPEFESVVNGRPAEGKGADVEVENLRATRAAFPDYVASVDRLVAQGDTVAAGWRIRGTHTGTHPQIPLPPTDRAVDFTGCTFLEIEGGRIVRGLNYIDVSTVMAQLGVPGVVGMLTYLVGGVVGVLLAGAALFAYRRLIRSERLGRAKLLLGLTLGAITLVAFLALSFRLRDILDAAG